MASAAPLATTQFESTDARREPAFKANFTIHDCNYTTVSNMPAFSTSGDSTCTAGNAVTTNFQTWWPLLYPSSSTSLAVLMMSVWSNPDVRNKTSLVLKVGMEAHQFGSVADPADVFTNEIQLQLCPLFSSVLLSALDRAGLMDDVFALSSLLRASVLGAAFRYGNTAVTQEAAVLFKNWRNNNTMYGWPVMPALSTSRALVKLKSFNLVYEAVQEFFAANPDAGSGIRAVLQAIESIKANIQWVNSNQNGLGTWLNWWKTY
ncbi:hypothetical protein EMCRGX_G034741 [Ephydatia muelleri]|eukprot:Em0023g633a